MPRNVKIIDRGWKRIQKEFKKYSDGEAVTIGVQGNKATEADPSHEGMTNVRLGVIHEFGTDDGIIPERSHFRSTFDENEKKYERELVDAAKRISAGESSIGELILLGEMARKDIIDKIKSNIPPPLSEGTIKRKGGETTALIDTGVYWNSISYVMQKLSEVDRFG